MGLTKFWGKIRDSPNGGRRREETEHQLLIFKFRGLSFEKKGFLLLFLIVYLFIII